MSTVELPNRLLLTTYLLHDVETRTTLFFLIQFRMQLHELKYVIHLWILDS